MFSSLLFIVIVHAACVIDKQDPVMRGDLCGKRTSASRYNCHKQHGRLDRTLPVIDRSHSQIFVDNRDFCLSHLHSTPSLGGPRRNIAVTFSMEN